MRFTAQVYVTLKPTVNDPQGSTVMSGLHTLGFDGVRDVRVGKFLTIDIEAGDAAEARRDAAQMCERLLANPVIESYRVEVSTRADT